MRSDFHHLKRQAHHDRRERDHRHAEGGSSDMTEDERLVRHGVHQHERNMHPGKKETKLHFAEGGHVEGEKVKARMDRAHGGRTKSHHGKGNVNVIVAPGGGGARPVPVPVPVGARPPMAPPPAGGVPAPTGMMAGMGAPRPPMAGPPVGAGVPGMRARGGRAFAKGGVVKLDAGAGSGLGRMEKIKDYGHDKTGESIKGNVIELEGHSASSGKERMKRGGRSK